MSRFRVRDFRFLDWRVDALSISGGEVVALLGESGSGKSLFLRALADLIVSEGEVTLEGKRRESMSAQDWRGKIGYLPAEILWWKDLVGEHFNSSPSADTLKRLKLKADVMEWETSRLSMGERQRLGLLRLLDREPQVLLLDEPTSNLDEGSVMRAEAVILDYVEKSGASVLWVSHSKEQAERVATRRFSMANKTLKEVQDV